MERFFIMVNLTFNDETQMKIVEFLQTTEKLLSDITSKLSHSPKKAKYMLCLIWDFLMMPSE